MAAVLAQPVMAFAHRQAQALEEDPWAWMARTCLKAGAGFLFAGFGLGTGAYFLKASATAAANNETRVIGNIGAIFSNIKAPTFKPAATGTAPLTANLAGVQNFFSDAWKDVQGAASDVAQIGGVMGTLGEDLADGFIDAAKAFMAFVMHFPDILWNGLVWGIGGAVADLMSWLFPWLIIIGVVLVLVGAVISAGSRLWNAGVKPAYDRASGRWLARREAKVEGFFDRVFHNPPLAIEAPPSSPAGPAAEDQGVPGAERYVPPAPTEAPPATPDGVGPKAESPPPHSETPVPGQISTPTPPPSVQVSVKMPEPAPGVMTRPEAEAYFGDRPNRAPTTEELAKMLVEAEAERQKTLPKKEPEVSGYEESKKAGLAFLEAESTEA